MTDTIITVAVFILYARWYVTARVEECTYCGERCTPRESDFGHSCTESEEASHETR